jgi:hypothetical protein
MGKMPKGRNAQGAKPEAGRNEANATDASPPGLKGKEWQELQDLTETEHISSSFEPTRKRYTPPSDIAGSAVSLWTSR